MHNNLQLSSLKILQNNEGFYIGRECIENGETKPFSRNSEYFKTEEQAECILYDSNHFDFYSNDYYLSQRPLP